ncbi:MAG: chromosome segregation SMC family protein, partial [Nitrososphaerota archaeon]
ETLRRLRLGRIKIIPLDGLSRINQVDLPRMEGIKEKISTFVKCPDQFASAVSFVLGDTLLATDEKAALLASHEGFRTVTLNGDLYQAGGGVESGFYRKPVDLSSIVPSESALKSLEQAVKTLRDHLQSRETSIGEIEKEIAETQGEILRLSEASVKLKNEIERINKSIHQTGINIKRAERSIEDLQNLLEKEKAQAELYEERQTEIAVTEGELRKTLADLKAEADLLRNNEKEKQREALGNDIIVLRQKSSPIETELSTLQSKMENIFKVNLENALRELDKVSKQMPLVQKEIEETLKERESVQRQINELEATKEDLSRSLLNAKEEAKNFTSQIDEIDNQLQQIDREYEQIDKMLDGLRLELQTFRFEMSRCQEQLKALGHEGPLEVSLEQVQETEAALRLMQLELERIGAVNQLAPYHYAEQVSRYKELSIRMNELEKEKIAILNFIESIEKKKCEAFMEAFNKMNEKLERYFSRLTGGGNAALKLENPASPFAGGVDMVVQFLNKPPILVSGASSGERSVAAVAFLFALQEFTPASFYLLDEIDAHLDAFHVEKLGELLAEESSKSQFIVITLKPEMVSKADRIYGVYGRNGISHVVSTTFKGAAR